MKIEEPQCPHGYPESQLREMLDDDGLANFKQWMVGQTASICQGLEYDHDLGEYVETQCASNPHGVVYYRSDLVRFLKHLPVID